MISNRLKRIVAAMDTEKQSVQFREGYEAGKVCSKLFCTAHNPYSQLTAEGKEWESGLMKLEFECPPAPFFTYNRWIIN